MLRQFGILILISCTSFVASAQDTLPSFTLVNKGSHRIIISWSNTYENIRQLSIQRSSDSIKNFKSILTLPDPTVPQNGYVDAKATTDSMYYRLYILLDSGKYVFTKSKRPVWDTIRIKEKPKETRVAELPVFEPSKPETTKVAVDEPKTEPGKPVVTEVAKTREPVKEPTKEPAKKETPKPEVVKPKEVPEKFFYVKRNDSVIAQLPEKSLRRFRDSMTLKTKDTISFTPPDTLVIKPFLVKFVYKTSKFVFTEKDGNIRIALPQAEEKKYTIKFFDELNTPVFEIKQIKQSVLTLDKSNFIHSGWFKFDLYEDGILKERSKVYVPKDF